MKNITKDVVLSNIESLENDFHELTKVELQKINHAMQMVNYEITKTGYITHFDEAEETTFDTIVKECEINEELLEILEDKLEDKYNVLNCERLFEYDGEEYDESFGETYKSFYTVVKFNSIQEFEERYGL
jgi:hypothetical protein